MNYYPSRIILYVETAKVILKCTKKKENKHKTENPKNPRSAKDSQDDLEEQS